MDLRDKYYPILASIADIPEYNRLRAEQRFLLIKWYEEIFLDQYQSLLGGEYRKYKATKKFCQINHISITTFYLWLRKYKKQGIMGLVPKFGRMKKKAKKADIVVLDAVDEPPRKRSKELKVVIHAKLEIEANRPLLCLARLEKIIRQCPLIAPETKASCSQALNFLLSLAQRRTVVRLASPLTEEEKHRLERYRVGSHKKHSNKATAILMMNAGRTMLDIGMATNSAESTLYRWLTDFNRKRLTSIKTIMVHTSKIEALELRKTRVIDIIHKLPSLYGINRTTWTYASISKAYEKEYGEPLSVDTIQRIVKKTGYTWRHARKILTSPDPEYKAKIERILNTLQGLKEGERFFFVDEVGPYRVKKYGGRALMPKDQKPETIPEYQKSRGKIQFVAALEAVTNQLTWMFTPDKSAASMIELIKKLTLGNAECQTIFLTWDALFVHSSKAVTEWISAHNESSTGPHIEVVPLPSNSQFLNVIESVFGGMKKAVICNSDYAGPQEMQEAIALHFEERNQYYQDNPKRAGNKIWDKQAFDIDKLAGGLFKKM